jgi:hypothetical protein
MGISKFLPQLAAGQAVNESSPVCSLRECATIHADAQIYGENLIRLSLSAPLTNVKHINFGARGAASTTPFVGRVGICYIVAVQRSKPIECV